MRLVVLLCLAVTTAHAGDLCAPGARHRGKVVDLDLKNADVHDVLRLLADTANINLVVAEAVHATITLRLQRVPWDAAACTIAKLHHLEMALDGTILLVTNAK